MCYQTFSTWPCVCVCCYLLCQLPSFWRKPAGAWSCGCIRAPAWHQISLSSEAQSWETACPWTGSRQRLHKQKQTNINRKSERGAEEVKNRVHEKRFIFFSPIKHLSPGPLVNISCDWGLSADQQMKPWWNNEDNFLLCDVFNCRQFRLRWVKPHWLWLQTCSVVKPGMMSSQT